MNGRKMRRVLGIAAAFALALTGCTGVPSNGGTAAGSSGVQGSGPASVVDQAKLKAAEYDYDAAISLLKGDTSADAQAVLADVQKSKDAATAWPTPDKVPHLFWHSLIVDPARAFSSTQTSANRVGWAQYMITQKEFEAELQSIYDKGYVLVHPERLYALDASGVMKAADPIQLPAGKKPIVISQDDVNYYSRQDNGGFARQLKIAADGTVVNTYQDARGAWHEGAYDVVSVVDQFVRQHPDFSYRGDKGSIAVTGYEGVLGYRSSTKAYGDKDTTKQAAADATKVADALKAEGWNFTCHTWSHNVSYLQGTLAQMQSDMALWDAEVKPIVGATHEMIYAFGSDLTAGISKSYSTSDPKLQYLHDTEGYDYFFPIDNTSPYFSQVKPTYYRQWRVDVDGITFQKVLDGKPTALPLFFDVKAELDPLRPIPTPKDKTGVA